MSEELTQNTNETPSVEYTDIERKAMEMGWRPKEEFSGDEVDFIDAKEFVNRKPLFDKIEHQSRQLKNVTKALEALKQHYTVVQETEYQRALAALKQERKTALVEGDGDKFDRIDDQIKDVEKQMEVVKANANTPAVQEDTTHPEFAAWIAKNTWYANEETEYMRVFADKFGGNLAKRGVPPAEVLKQVEQAVRKEFPNKFVNPNKELAPDVSTSRGTQKATKSDTFELTEQERNIMNTLVRGGHITKEKYLADLRAAKER